MIVGYALFEQRQRLNIMLAQRTVNKGQRHLAVSHHFLIANRSCAAHSRLKMAGGLPSLHPIVRDPSRLVIHLGQPAIITGCLRRCQRQLDLGVGGSQFARLV